MKSVKQLKKDSIENEAVNLLWTGGWDSTFRLLQLLFEEKKYVKPHYIVDAQECAGKEIDTMNNIRRHILRNYPDQRKLLLPVAYIGVGEIKKNQDITDEYKRIVKSKHIKKQYEFLARYCNQIGVSSMELGIHQYEIAAYFKYSHVIFKYFKLPISEVNKPEMAEIAKQNGWMELMKMTWFCRRPKKGKPCGYCGPCTDIVESGMSWRLPLKARIIANLQLPFRRWWRNNYQKQDKGILKYVSKYLKGSV